MEECMCFWTLRLKQGIILKEETNGKEWTGFIWLKVEMTGGFLRKDKYTISFHTRRIISSLILPKLSYKVELNSIVSCVWGRKY
jgi:hypothetical protein